MSNKKWELKLHDDVEDPYYELTNGPISLCATCGFVGETEGEEDEIFKRIANALNESGIEFHSENALELKQHILIQEWQAKYDELKEIVKDYTCKIAGLNQANAALKEIAGKMETALRRLSLSVQVHPDYDNDPNSEWGGYVESAEAALKFRKEGEADNG